ncbi:MAG: tRNA pseudouridine(55) synthase TruB [Salinivirgaceae bacterium]|jgi:tRNA pseudouridine55 synthase|nr:tRNA pseudouridine(55) synthase TruB [Bacteroidales bacterium]
MYNTDINTVKTNLISGEILLFDKPYKWTSFDVVNKVKWTVSRSLKLKKLKIGHAGTLDPLATGLLILCTGQKTKNIEAIQNQPKRYIATISLGNTTPSYDLETQITQTWSVDNISEIDVLSVLKKLTGTILQEPPLFSAKWVNGIRAYDLARNGDSKKLEPVEVNIYENKLLEYSQNEIKLEILCSKGTYIRAIARDIGTMLNNGAYLKELQRVEIGDFKLSNAQDVESYCDKIKQLANTQ